MKFIPSVISILAGFSCLILGTINLIEGNSAVGICLICAFYPWIRCGIEDIIYAS